MKVAIWGSYNYGNYGDDLMALQFATALQRMGVYPWVYRLDANLAKQYSIKTTNSLKELFDGAKFCIIGGGGMLVEKLVDDTTENDFQELYLISHTQNCPVFPISIGGDGQGTKTKMSFWKQKFFQSSICQTSTVRLEEDILLMKHLGKEAIYYPDILLSTQNFWQIASIPKSSKKLQVGINIGQSLPNKLLALQIRLITATRKDIVFHFIKTHLPNYNLSYEIINTQENSCIKQHFYTDIKTTLQFLNSLDLVISNKLHLGLTALALNVPFYSYGKNGKAQAFLKSINADSAIFPYKKNWELVDNISSNAKILHAINKFDMSMLEKLKKDSNGHLDFLKNILKQDSII